MCKFFYVEIACLQRSSTRKIAAINLHIKQNFNYIQQKYEQIELTRNDFVLHWSENALVITSAAHNNNPKAFYLYVYILQQYMS